MLGMVGTFVIIGFVALGGVLTVGGYVLVVRRLMRPRGRHASKMTPPHNGHLASSGTGGKAELPDDVALPPTTPAPTERPRAVSADREHPDVYEDLAFDRFMLEHDQDLIEADAEAWMAPLLRGGRRAERRLTTHLNQWNWATARRVPRRAVDRMHRAMRRDVTR